MLKINCARWNHTQEFLREEALRAGHPRTRERLMALSEISQGKSATKVGKQTKRNPQTVMEWVHRYNQEGLAALNYQRSGGRNPFFQKESDKKSVARLKRHYSPQPSHHKKEKLNLNHAGL